VRQAEEVKVQREKEKVKAGDAMNLSFLLPYPYLTLPTRVRIGARTQKVRQLIPPLRTDSRLKKWNKRDIPQS